jgi:hypothetical protein
MRGLFQTFGSENLVTVRGSENENRKNKYANDSILYTHTECLCRTRHPRADAHTRPSFLPSNIPARSTSHTPICEHCTQASRSIRVHL